MVHWPIDWSSEFSTSRETHNPPDPASPQLVALLRGFALNSAQVNPADGTVSTAKSSVQLEPKVMAVLVALAGRQGQVVSRNDLLAQVWSGAVVSDDALSRCIYQLRNEVAPLISDEPPQKVIQTLRKRGYRLNVPARTVDMDASARENGRRDSRAAKRSALAVVVLLVAGLIYWLNWYNASDLPVRSIAVLPFANMTGDESYEYLADGFSEQLSHAFANVPELRVAARTSAFYFKHRNEEIPTIAAQLGVESLIEGSIRRNGGELRVTVQFVDDEGFHIWSREYDRPQSDILALQSDISRAVLVELGIEQSAPAERVRSNPTENFAAYDQYLRGRFALSGSAADKHDRAIEYFRLAIKTDPRYAIAYSGLADALSLKVSGGQVKLDDVWTDIEAAINQALFLDSQLAEAHASRGLAEFVSGRHVEAEPHLRQAVLLNPNYVRAHFWLGLTLVHLDRFSEAIEAYKAAQVLDPLDSALNRNLGGNLLLMGRPEEGFSYLERAQRTAPEDMSALHMLATWNVVYGRIPGAIEWARLGLRKDRNAALFLRQLGVAQTQLGLWEAAEGSLLQAYSLDPDTPDLLRTLANLYVARDDRDALRNLLSDHQSRIKRGSSETDKADPVILSLQLILALLNKNPVSAVSIATEADPEALTCNHFGELGAGLYFAQALMQTGQEREAKAQLQSCLEDVNRIRSLGGTYPRTLYRMAYTLALSGEPEEAAIQLQKAVDLGWRAYWYAWNDPLWRDLKDQEPFRSIFAEVKEDLDKMVLQVDR